MFTSPDLIWQRGLQFLILAATLVAVFFHGFTGSSFLFIHDEYLPLPGHEIWKQFFVYNFVDFGSSMAVQQIVTLLDRIFYTLAYSNGLSLWQAQMLLYGLKLFIILFLPYLGFSQLARSFSGNTRETVVLATSFWYAFNTYTLIYWHGNAFSLTLLICYALAPLALYWWERVIFSEERTRAVTAGRLKDALVLAQLLFLMSFALYLFAPFVLLLIGYTGLRLGMGQARLSNTIRRLAGLAVICVPLFFVHLMVGYEMFTLSVGAHNTSGSETYGNMQGGLFYTALMWFTWPIYTYWTPRNVYTFADYFRTPISLLAPFILYGLILVGAARQRRNVYIIVFAFLLLIFFLLAKGAQEPFGALYIFFLENIPGFRVFRSPDTKFGFVIVLSIAVLLLLAGRAIKTSIFVILVMAVVIIQGWPLFTGIAIQGENKPGSHDRVIHIPNEYKQLANYLNEPARFFGYVMPMPAAEFGRYRLGRGEEHLGQDLLPKLINLPFIYVSESSGMGKPAYEKLMNILQSGNYGELRQFAIRYYVLRNDIRVVDEINQEPIGYIEHNYKLVFQNSLFRVYEDPSSPLLVDGENITFTVVNSSRVDVALLYDQIPDSLVLHQSFHPGWHLYVNTRKRASEGEHGQFITLFSKCFETISFLWKREIAEDSHNMTLGYANIWHISKEKIRSNVGISSLGLGGHSSKDTVLTFFYFPQAVFCLLAAVSLLFATGYFLVTCAILLIRVRQCTDCAIKGS